MRVVDKLFGLQEKDANRYNDNTNIKLVIDKYHIFSHLWILHFI